MSVRFHARRVALLIVLAGLALTAVACASGATGAATVADGTVEISAQEADFSVATIEARAGEPFTVRLTNHDPVGHNFAVYTSEGGDLIVGGEVITGSGTTTEVRVPALDAGTYFFRCDLHADHMNGALVVGG